MILTSMIGRTITDPKAAITALIESLGQFYKVERIRAQSFYDVNCKATVYLRYSREHNSKFYFGVTETDFRQYEALNLHIVFICGHPDTVFVIPSSKFGDFVEGSRVTSGQWKVNIDKRENKFYLRVSGKGRYDVTGYLNDFDFSPDQLRRFRITGEEFIPVREKLPSEVSPLVTPSIPLANELQISAGDSEHPVRFERALVEFFNAIGLKAKSIGGPGDTDVLVEAPAIFVVDGKTTKSQTVSQVNFTRLKQHKLMNGAEFALVAGVAFDPAVQRDALLEDTGLVTVETLVRILSLHKEMPATPHDYVKVFSTKGLIGDNDLAVLLTEATNVRSLVEVALLITSILDFNPKNVDEIKGWIDASFRATGKVAPSKEQIEGALQFLSSEVINVAGYGSDGFFLRYYRDQALHRLHSALVLFTGDPVV